VHESTRDVFRSPLPSPRLLHHGLDTPPVLVRSKREWKSPDPLRACPFDSNRPCCKKKVHCYKYFEEDVEGWRRANLFDSTENEETTRARLKEHRVSTPAPGGKKYCFQYLMWWSGWSSKRLFPGIDVDPRPRESVKDIATIAWFAVLKDFLEQMPDRPVYQLAAPLKSDVYLWYEEDSLRWPTLYPHVSRPYFLATWRNHVKEVQLRRVLRFTKCERCSTLRDIRWDRQQSVEKRNTAMKDLKDHYSFVKKERGYALMKAHRGVIDPSNVLSIAQDGTQQLPNGLPQFAQAIHGQEKAHNRLHHHLTLSMVHGMGTRCYVTRDNVYSDPNLTIECLQRTLKWVEEARGGKLPNQLYLQLDNCFRENKNSLLLNWLASLVERGLFPGGIEVGFLPVGHTHNEVDQVASRISIALRRREIHTPAQLFALLKECFVGLDVQLVQHVADTQSFIQAGREKSWKNSRFMRHQNISRLPVLQDRQGS